MKPISKIIICITASISLFGCSEAVERASNEVQSGVIVDAFEGEGVNVALFNETVEGIYSEYRAATLLNRVVATTWAGDDITVESRKRQFTTFDNRTNDFRSPEINDAWTDLFEVYVSIFSAIESITENFNNNVDQEALNQNPIGQSVFVDNQFFNLYIAELRFLRANILHYFARVHGRAPVIEAVGQEPNGLMGGEDLYKLIESDLLFAEENLTNLHPNDRELEGAARPNKGSARAFLARLYMDWAGWPLLDSSRYTMAAEKAKLVIDNAADHGFALLSNFEDLWLQSNARNPEAVFMITFNGALSTDDQDNRKYGRVGYSSADNGWDETFSEIRFWEDFPEGPRKDGTFRRDLDDEWIDYEIISCPVYTKITGPQGDLDPLLFNTSRSDFYIRYADVLLMYAEATGRSGDNGNPEAWEALNQVRRRAYPPGTPDLGPSDGDLAEITFTERKWEFAGEFLRWFDLIRMQKVEEALGGDARTPRTTRNSAGELLTTNIPLAPDANLGPDNYFAPIPRAVLAANPSFTP